MSLLLDTQPLIVLPELAIAVGLNEAIIMQQVHYWVIKSPKVRDGFEWTYNTYEEWQQQFPWWSRDTIKRTIQKLEKRGLLISANYNQMAMDRTKWYRLDYDKLYETISHGGNLHPSSVQSAPMQQGNLHPPLPETTTETNTDIKLVPTEQGATPDKRDPEVQQVVEYFETTMQLQMPKPQLQRRAAKTLISRVGLVKTLRAIDAVAACRHEQYAPSILDLMSLRDKFNNLVDFYRRKQTNSKVVVL